MSLWDTFQEWGDNLTPDDATGWIPRAMSGAIDTIPGGRQFFETYDKTSNLINQAGSWTFSALPGGPQTLDWDEARNVPVGQSMIASGAGFSPAFGAATSAIAGMDNDLGRAASKVTPWAATGFDFNDPNQRKAAFEDQWYGSVLSGAAGAAFTWYADPLVIGGKAIKVARIGGNIGGRSVGGWSDRALRTADDVERFAQDIDAHVMWTKSGGVAGKRTGAGEAVARTVRKDAAQMYFDPLARKSNDRGLVASLLGESDDLELSALIVKAGAGHAPSQEALAAKAADVADALQRYEQIDSIAQRIVRTPRDLTQESFFDFTPTDLDKLDAVVKELKAKDDYLQRAVAETQDAAVISRAGGQWATGVAARAALTDVRTQARYMNAAKGMRESRKAAERAKVGPAFIEETFQRHPWMRPVRVWNWVTGERSSGWVGIKGTPANDSASEIFAVLNSSRALRSGVDHEDFLRGSMNRYLGAATPTERMNAVLEIEREATARIAERYGVSTDRALELYETYARARTSAQHMAQKRGYLVEWDGSVAVLKHDPVLSTQLEDAIPMMDMDVMEDVLRRHKYVLARKVGKAKDVVHSIADTLYAAWRASVLFRAGYTIRNVAEGNLRSAAAIGFLPMFAEPWTVMKNFAANQKNFAKYGGSAAFDIWTRQNPRYLQEVAENARIQRNMYRDLAAREVSAGRYVRQWDPLDPVSGTPETMTLTEYIDAAPQIGQRLNMGDVDQFIASPSQSLLPSRQRREYGALNDKVNSGGKLSDVEAERLRHLRAKAIRSHLREAQGNGMEVVYRYPRTGELLLVDNPSQIADTVLVPVEVRTRRGVPAGAVDANIASEGEARLRRVVDSEPEVYLLPKWRTEVRAAQASGMAVPGRVAVEAGSRNPRAVGGYASNLSDDVRERFLYYQGKAREWDEALSVARDNLDVALTRRQRPTRRRRGDDAAYAGPYGDIARLNASADRSNALTITDALTANQAQLQRQQSWIRVNPEDEQYFDELANIANNQFAADELAQRVLRGDSTDELAAWLGGPEGSRYRRDMGLSRSDVAGHVDVVDRMVKRYIPDESLRFRLSRGERLAPEQLSLALRQSAAGLSPIHGREPMNALNLYGSPGKAYRGAVRAAYTVLGTIPENIAVRHPFYNEVWKTEFARVKGILEQQGRTLNREALERVNRAAHKAALRETKRTLYTIERYSNPSAVLRWLFPFFPAWENTLKTWTRLSYEDLSVPVRASMIWNAPNEVGMVVDSDGNEVPPGGAWKTDQFIVLPEPLGKAFGKLFSDQVADIPKGSLNVILQGQTPWLPGAGPLVTMPVSWVVAANPTLEESIQDFFGGGETGKLVYEQLVPFGRPTSDPSDTLLPAWAQRAQTLVGGEGSPEFMMTAVQIWRDDYTRWIEGGSQGPAPSAESALERARDYYKMRMVANLTLPFSPRVRSPYQFYLDEWNRLKEQYGYEEANRLFDERHGETFALFKRSLTQGQTGMSPSQQAYNVYKSNRSLWNKVVQQDPSMGQIITNPGGYTGQDFSYAVYQWQRGRPVAPGSQEKFRDVQSIQEFQNGALVEQGWQEYIKAKTLVDEYLKSNGLTNLQQSGADDAAAAWRDWLLKAEQENPTWYSEYVLRSGEQTNRKVITTLQLATGDEEFMRSSPDRQFWATAQEYLAGRQQVVDWLLQADSAGGSADINAKQNYEVYTIWQQYVERLRASNVTFADFYDRWLEKDMMRPVSVDGD